MSVRSPAGSGETSRGQSPFCSPKPSDRYRVVAYWRVIAGLADSVATAALAARDAFGCGCDSDSGAPWKPHQVREADRHTTGASRPDVPLELFVPTYLLNQFVKFILEVESQE